MDSPIQGDPYLALGVTKLSSAGDVKSAYRKLVLKCHPDKVADPALKQQKADEFHQIQQAYEILNDEDKRNRYDATVRLAELKAEMMRRDAGRGHSSKGSMYDARPTTSTYPSYSRGSAAHVEVRTPRFTDDLYEEPRPTTRKHDPSSAYTRRTSPQSAKPEKERRTEKEEKARSERRRAREADVRESRDRKYYSSTEDVNDRARYEEDRKKRDGAVKQKEEEARKYNEYAKIEETRRANEEARARATKVMYESQRGGYDKYSSMVDDARRYQASAEQGYSSTRPQPARTSSGHQHAEVRRSRAKGSETRRRSPEVVERSIPSFSKSATMPEKLKEMAGERGMLPRSYSHDVQPEAREYAVPTPPMRRSDSMPVPTPSSVPQHSSSSRRKEELGRHSRLRQSETVLPDSGYSSSSPVPPDATQNNPYLSTQHPSIPPAAAASTASVNRTTYHYPSAGVTGEPFSTSPDKYTASMPYKTEVRIPAGEREKDKDRERRRAHEPTSTRERDRPPMASARTIPTPSAAHYPHPPVRTPSYSHRSPDGEHERDHTRDRDREGRRSAREMAYAEVPSEYTRRNNLQPKSYEKEQVNVGKQYSVDDIKFASRGRAHEDPYLRSGRERDRAYDGRERYDRPSLPRSSTFAY